MTLNGEMAVIFHYFTEFVFVKQLLGLPRFQNLLLVGLVVDHINICAIIQRCTLHASGAPAWGDLSESQKYCGVVNCCYSFSWATHLIFT